MCVCALHMAVHPSCLHTLVPGLHMAMRPLLLTTFLVPFCCIFLSPCKRPCGPISLPFDPPHFTLPLRTWALSLVSFTQLNAHWMEDGQSSGLLWTPDSQA